jgi:predicted DNA-binding transcriptional regulator YafY
VEESRIANPDALRTLRTALTEHRCVEMVYYTFARDAYTTRVIEPIAMEDNYLSAFCRCRGEVRTFACWRIVSAKLLDERFSPHPYVPPRTRPPFDDYEPTWTYEVSRSRTSPAGEVPGSQSSAGCLFWLLATLALYLLLRSCI